MPSFYDNDPYSNNQRWTGGPQQNGTVGSQTPQSVQNANNYARQNSQAGGGYADLARQWADALTSQRRGAMQRPPDRRGALQRPVPNSNVQSPYGGPPPSMGGYNTGIVPPNQGGSYVPPPDGPYVETWDIPGSRFGRSNEQNKPLDIQYLPWRGGPPPGAGVPPYPPEDIIEESPGGTTPFPRRNPLVESPGGQVPWKPRNPPEAPGGNVPWDPKRPPGGPNNPSGQTGDYYTDKANEYNTYDTPWKGTITRDDVAAYHHYANQAAANGKTNIHITEWLQAGRPTTFQTQNNEAPNPWDADFDPLTGQLPQGWRFKTPTHKPVVHNQPDAPGGGNGGGNGNGGNGNGGNGNNKPGNNDGAPDYQEFDANGSPITDIMSKLREQFDPQFKSEREYLDRMMRQNASINGSINSGGFGATYAKGMGDLVGKQGAQIGQMGFQAREAELDRALKSNLSLNQFELDKWINANKFALEQKGIDVERYKADQAYRAALAQANAMGSAAQYGADAAKYNADLDYRLGTQRLGYDNIFNQRQYDLGVLGINRDIYQGDQGDRFRWANLLWNMSPDARLSGPNFNLPDMFPY